MTCIRPCTQFIIRKFEAVLWTSETATRIAVSKPTWFIIIPAYTTFIWSVISSAKPKCLRRDFRRPYPDPFLLLSKTTQFIPSQTAACFTGAFLCCGRLAPLLGVLHSARPYRYSWSPLWWLLPQGSRHYVSHAGSLWKVVRITVYYLASKELKLDRIRNNTDWDSTEWKACYNDTAWRPEMQLPRIC